MIHNFQLSMADEREDCWPSYITSAHQDIAIFFFFSNDIDELAGDVYVRQLTTSDHFLLTRQAAVCLHLMIT